MQKLIYQSTKDFEVQIPVSGIWQVYLKAFPKDGEDSGSGAGTVPQTIRVILVVAIENNSINFTIHTQVLTLLPSGFSLGYEAFNLYRTKWQQILGPNLFENKADYTYEFSYPIKYNMLIAYLVIRDMLIKAGNDFLLSTFEGSLSTSENTGIQGSVKAIRTGPVETEWFESSSTLKEIFKAGGKYDTINSACCSLADDLGIKLSFCRSGNDNTVPTVLKPNKTYAHSYFPMEKAPSSS
jgi:hypothetical protein